MTITLDSAPSAREIAINSSSLTYSHTRAAGAGALLVSIVNTVGASTPPASVTYGGAEMTRIASQEVGSTANLSVYAITFTGENAGGAANVVITMGVQAPALASTRASFSGAIDLASPNFNLAVGSATNVLQNTITVADGAWVFIGGASVNADLTAGTNVTATTSANPLSGRYGPKVGAGSVGLTLNSPVTDTIASIAVELAESLAESLTVTDHPDSQTVSQPIPASFSVAATGGTPPYSYQWQRYPSGGSAWESVTSGTGGTAAAYTTAATTQSGGSASAGDQYRCVITDSATRSVTSNAATLTVTPPTKYTLVDATDALVGQAIRVLVPNANASVPYTTGTPTPAIIYCHGAGENETALLSDPLKADCVTALLDAGYILAGSNAFDQNWGNQNGVRAYYGLEKYLRDNYNIKGIGVWSHSMGGLAGLNVVAHGHFKVFGWLGTAPVCSLSSMTSGFGGAINSAYGVTGSGIYTYDNQTYGFDPALRHGSAYRETPMRFYASSGDTIVGKTSNTDVLAELVGNTRREAEVVVCSGDHSDPSHFKPAEYVAFFDRCFAIAERTITLSLMTPSNSPAANISGLKWAFWEVASLGALKTAPVAAGVTGATDPNGVLTISVMTALDVGAVGWLVVTNSDGNPASDHNAFSGPVVVS